MSRISAGSARWSDGENGGLLLDDAPPNALALLWISVASSPFEALGGTVHAYPFVGQALLGTDAAGEIVAITTWPDDLEAGTKLWFQFICHDTSVPGSLTLSHGLLGVAH